jgi:hypothetical protein
LLKEIRFALPVIAAFALGQAAHAQEFEGSVTYQMKSGDAPPMEMVHHVKGKDIRVDMNAQGESMSIITDHGGSKQIVVMHKNKQWMDYKAMQEKMGAMMPNMPRDKEQKGKAPAELNIKATGEKETIAGHQCEHYIFTSDGTKVDICAAKGLGWYFASPGGGSMMGKGGPMGQGGKGESKIPGLSNAQLEQWKKLYTDGFFPLKITVAGERPMTMVATNVSKKGLEASVFLPPAGYSEMKMGGD